MGREVRKVPPYWQHPKNQEGNYIPLMDGYKDDSEKFLKRITEKGLQDAIDWFGKAPDKNDYMPSWTDQEATHYMMYENVSEGTPISPAFETPEALARWLADTNSSAFGDKNASYEAWLRVCKGGYAPSMVIANNRLMSGVEGVND